MIGNQYLESLALTLENDAYRAEVHKISDWIIALLDQYKLIRGSLLLHAETYTFDHLYFLSPDELIYELIQNPLEPLASGDYIEFLLALYHVVPLEQKNNWFQLELNKGVLAADIIAYKYEALFSSPILEIIEALGSTYAELEEERAQENHLISIELPNIDHHPNILLSHPAHPEAQITMGDAHGNVMRMIHFLAYQGVLVISETNYRLLAKYYMTIATNFIKLKKELETGGSLRIVECRIDTIKTAMDRFIANLTKNTSFNPVGLVRWMGDIVGDRGALDYLILILLNHMKNAGIHMEIMLSNHDLNLINWYENFPAPPVFVTSPYTSLDNMLVLIKYKVIDPKKIIQIINYCYKPALKIVSYSINQKGTQGSLFTHAPIQKDLIHTLGARLGFPVLTHNIQAFLYSIDRINRIIQDYTQRNKLMSILSPTLEMSIGAFNENKYNIHGNPFITALWNRDVDLNPLSVIAGCEFVLVHAHHLVETPRAGFIGLNKLLGLGVSLHDAADGKIDDWTRLHMNYVALYSTQRSSLQPKLDSSKSSLSDYSGGFFSPRPVSMDSATSAEVSAAPNG